MNNEQTNPDIAAIEARAKRYEELKVKSEGRQLLADWADTYEELKYVEGQLVADVPTLLALVHQLREERRCRSVEEELPEDPKPVIVKCEGDFMPYRTASYSDGQWKIYGYCLDMMLKVLEWLPEPPQEEKR